jgi:hypothetical protein
MVLRDPPLNPEWLACSTLLAAALATVLSTLSIRSNSSAAAVSKSGDSTGMA